MNRSIKDFHALPFPVQDSRTSAEKSGEGTCAVVTSAILE